VTANGIKQDSITEHLDSAFVGRKRELSSLGAALQQAQAGFGSIFLLSGEAGTGKTFLVRAFSAYARFGGAKVLEGRASVRFRDVPFGLWKQILSDRPDQHEASGSAVLPIGSSSALIVSSPFQPPTDHQTNSTLFEAAACALVEHTKTQPLVLVFDDLHAADPVSLQAFRVLARELARFGTLVIGAYRDSEINRFHEFGDLLLDPQIRDSKKISLAVFDDEETREFAQSRTAGPLKEETLAALQILTGGNPRLLDIALRSHLAEETPLGSGKFLSGFLRAEIEAHLEHLSAQAKEVLSTASLAGVEFRISSLAHVLEQGPAELLDSLQEAEQSGLLRRTEIPGTYRFRQKIVQEILCAELPGGRRARLHKRFGEVMAALHPQDDAFVERIASHFYEAALLGCADKAADYCSRAGVFARRDSRMVDALRFYHMALAALELQGTNPDAISEVKARLDELSFRRTPGSSLELGAARSNAAACENQVAVPRAEETPGQEIPSKPSPDGRFELLLKSEATAPSNDTPLRVRSHATPDDDAKQHVRSRSSGSGSDDLLDQPFSEVKKNTFRRDGDFWTLIFGERVLRLKHSNGLAFVAHLLQNPDRDFHVAQLVALLPSARANHADAVHMSRSERERLGMHEVIGKDSNPLLDPTAKAAYRRRIEELRAALEEAKGFNDAARAADLETELDFIALELSRAVGVGGRDRRHRAEDERARVNVTNAIRALTVKITKQHPSFGRYLRTTIRTGRFCSYHPDPQEAPTWRF